MEMSQLEALLGRTLVEGHPTRHFLASIHRGDAFTRVFSLVLITFVWIQGLLIGLAWVSSWGRVYYQFERWELVLAFVDQFFVLGMLYVMLHITFLRSRHLRQIPSDPFISLQAIALILRWFGECVLVMSLGALGHALLGVPEPGWMSSFLGGFGAPVSEGDLKTGIKAWSLFSMGWLQIAGFGAFTCFYALASLIEVFLAIERNSRESKRSFSDRSEVTGRGREVPLRQQNGAHQENAMVQI